MLRLTCCMEYTCCWTGLYMMFKHRFMYPLLFCLPYTSVHSAQQPVRLIGCWCFAWLAPGSCPRMWAFLPTWMCLESSLKTTTYWQQTPWRMHVGWLTQSSRARRRSLLCTSKHMNKSEQAASLHQDYHTVYLFRMYYTWIDQCVSMLSWTSKLQVSANITLLSSLLNLSVCVC